MAEGRVRRAARLIVLIPAAVVLILLAIANRESVTFSLDPFRPGSPALSASLPLFVWLFAALAIGIVVGGAATWFRQGRWRKAARQEHAEIERLRREAERHAAATGAPSVPVPVRRDAA